MLSLPDIDLNIQTHSKSKLRRHKHSQYSKHEKRTSKQSDIKHQIHSQSTHTQEKRNKIDKAKDKYSQKEVSSYLITYKPEIFKDLSFSELLNPTLGYMRRNGKGNAEDVSMYRKFLKIKYDSLEKMLS